MSDFEVPPELEAMLRDRLAEGEELEERRALLADRVAGIPAPLGDLLRTITRMHEAWRNAEYMRLVTEAESMRMEQIIDAAVSFVDCLRGDR